MGTLSYPVAAGAFFARCLLGPVTSDVYLGNEPKTTVAIVHKAGMLPTVVGADVVTGPGGKFSVKYPPLWGLPEMSMVECKAAPPADSADDVTEIDACLYWVFASADLSTPIAELVKKGDAIPCKARVQCETPDRPDLPGTCLKIKILEKIIPVDPAVAKLCSVK